MMKNIETFNLRRAPNFFKNMNRDNYFDINDMDGKTPNFKLILCSESANEFNDCIDVDGTLLDWDEDNQRGVEVINTFGEDDGLIALNYHEGINDEFHISVNNMVYYDLGEYNLQIKSLFLVSYGNGSGYVLAYSINNKPLTIPYEELFLRIKDDLISLTSRSD